MAKRSTRFTYQVLNLKLISNSRKGTEAYRQIIQDIFDNSISKPTTRGKNVILRSLFPTESWGNKFYYGKISRFTDLENNDWLNVRTKEVEHPILDDGLFPNLQETDFVFVPQAHRFIIRKSPSFTVFNAKDFFTKAIREVIEIDEDFNVIIEQSQDIYDDIYKAIRVDSLDIRLSYTNSDDLADEAMAWMDEELKESGASTAQIKLSSNEHVGLNIETKLVQGALGLAVENGDVEAVILDENNRRRKVITKDHPNEIRTSAPNEDEVKNVIFTEVMTKYRNGQLRTNED